MTSHADFNCEIITELSYPASSKTAGAIAVLAVQSSKGWQAGFYSFIICDKITNIII